LRIVYLGTPEFAVPPLERCLAADHEIAAVYTQPDRPKGRGRSLAASPVKQLAESRRLEIRQPLKIRDAEEELRALVPQAMVVVGYGQIIPQSIIDIAPLGIVNVHASLLPKYRGAAPIQRAIAAGETVTGVTTMQIDAGLDTGDILMQAQLSIGEEETAAELSPRLAVLGANLLVETLAALDAGRIAPRKQNDAEATYAPVLKKEEGEVDWTLTAAEIFHRARGFQPWPGCYTTFRDRTLHIVRCRPSAEVLVGQPGSAVSRRKQLFVACGHATTLEILELQLEGRRRAMAADFLNGQRIGENEILGAVRA
jgi:methionyl-tRNA formyltransferase